MKDPNGVVAYAKVQDWILLIYNRTESVIYKIRYLLGVVALLEIDYLIHQIHD